MKILHMLLLLSLCSSATVNAEAQNPFSFQPSFRQSGDIVIPTGNVPETRTVRFPALERHPGNGAVLYFRPYLKTGKANGWNNYLTLRLNGKLLAQYTEDGFPRLLRRGESMGNTFRDKWPWWRNNAWLVYFNDGKSDLDPRITSHREEKYDYFTISPTPFISSGKEPTTELRTQEKMSLKSPIISSENWAEKNCGTPFSASTGSPSGTCRKANCRKTVRQGQN